MKEFRCNGEMLEVKNNDGEWHFVVDCTEGLSYMAECIIEACDIDYIFDDEYDEDDEDVE